LRGSQNGRPARRPRPQPSTPANDNRAPGTPANDNRPQGRSHLPKTYSGAHDSYFRAARVFAFKAAKVHPALRAASTVYDLYRLWHRTDWRDLLQDTTQLMQQEPGEDYAGLRSDGTCVGASGSFRGYGFGPFYVGPPPHGCSTGQVSAFNLEDRVEELYDYYRTRPNTWQDYAVVATKDYYRWVWKHNYWRYYKLDGSGVNPVPLRPGAPKNSYAHPAPAQQPAPFWPSVEPASIPIHQPSATPQPVPHRLVPYRRTDPYGVPGHRWVRGPGRAPAPDPYLLPSQVPAIRTTVQVREDGATTVRHEPAAAHTRRPPGRGEKEKKFKTRGQQAAYNIARAIGEAGEFADVIEVGHDSLPEEYQTESDRIFDKAQAVFQNSEHIDWREFWKNWAGNDLEDKAVGKLLGGEHGRKIGWALSAT
jgi:hypothetical protein